MPNPIKPIANLPKDVGEAVGQPLIDETGTIVDEALNSILGQQPTPPPPKNPQQEAQKKAEDQRKIQNILRYFDTLKSNAASYKQSQDVKNQQERQEELAEEQENKQKDFQKTQKKQQAVEVYRAQRKSEIKVKGG